jgi:hypothetical protein
MSETRILTSEDITKRRACAAFVDPPEAVTELCDSHEALRAERDAAMRVIEKLRRALQEGNTAQTAVPHLYGRRVDGLVGRLMREEGLIR